MSKREVADLATRVLAVYALLQAIAATPHLLALLTPFAMAGMEWVEKLQVVLWGMYPLALYVIAIFMWSKSALVAAWMTGYDIQDHPSEPDAQRERPQMHEIHAIAFSVLGLWVLMDTLPYVPTRVGETIAMAASESSEHLTVLQLAFVWLEIFIRLIAGVWLLFGASGLIVLLKRIRTIGLEHDPLTRSGSSEQS